MADGRLVYVSPELSASELEATIASFQDGQACAVIGTPSAATVIHTPNNRFIHVVIMIALYHRRPSEQQRNSQWRTEAALAPGANSRV